MFEWEAAHQAIADWLTVGLVGTAAANVPTGSSVPPVRWSHTREAADVPYQGVWGELAIRSVEPIGHDETRWEENTALPAGRDFIPTVCGLRYLRVNVRVWSMCQGTDLNPIVYVERARTALKLPSVFRRFKAAGLAWLDAERSIEIPAVISGRDCPAAEMPIRFMFAEGFADTGDGYFNRITGTGTTAAEDGNVITTYDSADGGP